LATKQSLPAVPCVSPRITRIFTNQILLLILLLIRVNSCPFVANLSSLLSTFHSPILQNSLDCTSSHVRLMYGIWPGGRSASVVCRGSPGRGFFVCHIWKGGCLMSTSAQIEANRANSLKSTGPKTEEGKAISSRNALKHGFFSEDVC